MRSKTFTKPRVKDLLAILNKCDPEALLLISDGHEGVCQMRVWDGVIHMDPKGWVDAGYVFTTEDVKTNPEYAPKNPMPAVQIDTDV